MRTSPPRCRRPAPLLAASLLAAAEALRAARVCDVRKSGATGDGQTKDTKAIQAAIDDCGKHAGGGVVVLRPGAYLSGSLWLRSRVTLRAAPPGDWRGTWEDFPRAYVPDVGQLFGGEPHAALLNGGRCARLRGRADAHGDQCAQWQALRDVTVEGEGPESVIDGSGAGWHAACGHLSSYRCPDGAEERWARPRLVHMMKVEGLVIRNLLAKDAAFWTIVPQYSRNVLISGVAVTAPHHDSFNTDGFNVQSSKDVHIVDSSADTGDDCVAVYSGSQKQGMLLGLSTAHVLVERFRCLHGHGIAVGSRTATVIQDVTFRDIEFNGTLRGPRIKTCRGRGGLVEGVRFQNITMHKVRQAFELLANYEIDSDYPEKESAGVPRIRDVLISDVRGDATGLGVVEGLPEAPLTGLTFRNVHVKAKTGLQLDRRTVRQLQILGRSLNLTGLTRHDGPHPKLH